MAVAADGTWRGSLSGGCVEGIVLDAAAAVLNGAALTGGAGHVAALGSRDTHRQRMRRLDGLPGLQRLAAPAGLDLGGACLAETALSILAGIVAVDNGRAGGPLRDSNAPIGTGRPLDASTVRT